MHRLASVRPAAILLACVVALESARPPVHPPAALRAQDTPLAAVRALFDGMRAGDSAAVRRLFVPAARLASIGAPRGGGPAVLRDDRLADFLKAIGTPHDKAWDERTWDEEVRVDGPLASIWTPYAFYLGGTFSHCGVDAFQLAQLAEGWRIVSLVDTQRREGCSEPPVRPASGETLMQRDRKFDAVLASSPGVETWLRFFADDAAQLGPDHTIRQGHAAIRALMRSDLDDSPRQLRWRPTEGALFDGGQLGLSVGRWQSLDRRSGQVQLTGRYVTIWRKQADGEWKIIFDTGEPDPR
ncbi:MAG: DUF4440 domain-containing protein [Gemmatimonadales bacterium]|nr:DUF4440 domain-containing protein [Gemmatimonadales bacterium]